MAHELKFRSVLAIVGGVPVVQYVAQAFDSDTAQPVGKLVKVAGRLLDGLGFERQGGSGTRKLSLLDNRRFGGTWFLRPKASAEDANDPTFKLGPQLFGSVTIKKHNKFRFDGKAGKTAEAAEVMTSCCGWWYPDINLDSKGEMKLEKSVRVACPIEGGQYVGPMPVGENRILPMGSPLDGDLFGGIDLETGLVNICLVEEGKFLFRTMNANSILQGGGAVEGSIGKVKFKASIRKNGLQAGDILGASHHLEIEVLDGSPGFLLYLPTPSKRDDAPRRKFLSALANGGGGFYGVSTSGVSLTEFGKTYMADELPEETVSPNPSSDTESKDKGEGEEKGGKGKGDKKTKKTA